MEKLLSDIKQCTLCANHLPLGPNPVLRADPRSKILIIGQAPGTKVHKTGIPWNDPSGDQLRKWLDTDKEIFYDSSLISIIPMGFCYPGKGKSGDLPPRPECAPKWHPLLLEQLPELQLVLLIGQYAQQYYLREKSYKTLTENVRHYETFGPFYFPLPHPSPRNRMWLYKNTWFEEEVVPELRKRFKALR